MIIVRNNDSDAGVKISVIGEGVKISVIGEGVKISVSGEGVKIVSLVKGLTCVSGEGVKIVSVVRGLISAGRRRCCYWRRVFMRNKTPLLV